MAKLIELIYTEERTGMGTNKNPFRIVTQLWTKEGCLIAEHDKFLEKEFFNPNKINI